MKSGLGVSFVSEMNENKGLAKHQIDSYNDFILHGLQKLISDIGSIAIELPTGEEISIKLGRVSVSEPQLRDADGSVYPIYPSDARLRNLTYSSPLFVEMTPVFEGVEHNTEVIEIGELPVMVGSILCPTSKMSVEERIEKGEDPYDRGGYFIIKGTERVVIISEEVASNKIIYQKDNGVVSARLNSERAGYVQRHLIDKDSTGIYQIKFANVLDKPLPLVVLFKVLGFDTDEKILTALNPADDETEQVLINLYSSEVTNKEEALEFISKKLKIRQKEDLEERIMPVIDRYLLAHLGNTPESRLLKAKYLAKIMMNLIRSDMGKIKEDDLDHYANKRLNTVGDLLSQLIRSIIVGRWGLVARLQYNYQKMMKRGRRLLKMQSVVVSEVFTSQIMRAMATGNWLGERTGVVQRLERTNFIRSIGHLRSVVSPLSSTQEHFEARELHATKFGRICAVRTPEGQNIGLRNYLGLATQIVGFSDPANSKKIVSFLEAEGANVDKAAADLAAE